MKIVFWTILLGGTASVVYIYRRQLWKLFFKQEESTPNIASKEPITTDAMTEVAPAFLMYADNFEGLFEPIYKSSQDIISLERKRTLLSEWNIRMNSIGKIPITLLRWWETIVEDLPELSNAELQERARSIVNLLNLSQIIRDDRTELVVEKDTTMYYNDVNEKEWKIGQKLHVISPCWYIQCEPVRIIEKGFCEIM